MLRALELTGEGLKFIGDCRNFRNLQEFIGNTVSRMEVCQGMYMVPEFIPVTSHLRVRRRPVWTVFPHKQEDERKRVVK